MSVSRLPRSTEAVHQGEIYEWGGAGRYMLVMSADDHNQVFDPLCAPIVRTAPEGLYVVALANPDPIGGRIICNLLTPVPRHELAGYAGMVTGETWSRCGRALATFLGFRS